MGHKGISCTVAERFIYLLKSSVTEHAGAGLSSWQTITGCKTAVIALQQAGCSLFYKFLSG